MKSMISDHHSAEIIEKTIQGITKVLMTVSESFDEKDVLTWQDDTFMNFTMKRLDHYLLYDDIILEIAFIDTEGNLKTAINKMSNNQVRMNKSEYVNSIYADAVSKLKNITAGELHVSPLKMVDMLEGSEVKTLPAIQMGNKIHENGIHKGYMIVTYNGQSLLNVINGHNKIEGIKKNHGK